jgi:hypothetical protein
LIMRLDIFTSRKPASFTRLIYECVVLTDTLMLQTMPIAQFMENYVVQVNPFIIKYTSEPVW